MPGPLRYLRELDGNLLRHTQVALTGEGPQQQAGPLHKPLRGAEQLKGVSSGRHVNNQLPSLQRKFLRSFFGGFTRTSRYQPQDLKRRKYLVYTRWHEIQQSAQKFIFKTQFDVHTTLLTADETPQAFLEASGPRF